MAVGTRSTLVDDIASERPQPIPLGEKEGFFEIVTGLFLSPAAQRALVTRKNAPPGDKATARMHVCDLASGEIATTIPWPPDVEPMCISADGSWLVARSEPEDHGKADTLSVYSLTADGSTKLVAEWRPYHHDERFGSAVTWASAIGSDHLATVSRGGQLALWTTPELRPIYYADLELARASPTLSPGGKQLAVPTKEGILFLDALTGEQLGALPAKVRSGPLKSLLFRPDGRRLALSGHGRVRVWDLDTQQLIRDFPVQRRGSSDAAAWVGGDYLLLDSRQLIDVERRIVLWDYGDRIQRSACHAGRTWFVEQGVGRDTRVLASRQLPHPAALELAKGLNAEELLVIRPGMKVAVEVYLATAGASQQDVNQTLAKKLEEVGLVVSDEADVRLIANLRSGKSETVEYREFGSFRTSEHTAVRQRLEIVYEINGHPVWTYLSETVPPHFLHLKKDETVDQALRRVMRQEPESFAHVWIPGWVASTKDYENPADDEPPRKRKPALSDLRKASLTTREPARAR